MMRKIWNRARKDQRGFTLIELLAVVAILGILAAFAVPRITDAVSDAKASRGKSDITVIRGALDRYYFDKGAFPANFKLLVDEGLLKKNFDGKNAYAKRYFYAVSADTKKYMLGDPGANPTATTYYQDSNGGTIPEGKAPGTNEIVIAYTWGAGATLPTGATTFQTTDPTRTDLITD